MLYSRTMRTDTYHQQWVCPQLHIQDYTEHLCSWIYEPAQHWWSHPWICSYSWRSSFYERFLIGRTRLVFMYSHWVLFEVSVNVLLVVGACSDIGVEFCSLWYRVALFFPILLVLCCLGLVLLLALIVILFDHKIVQCYQQWHTPFSTCFSPEPWVVTLTIRNRE